MAARGTHNKNHEVSSCVCLLHILAGMHSMDQGRQGCDRTHRLLRPFHLHITAPRPSSAHFWLLSTLPSHPISKPTLLGAFLFRRSSVGGSILRCRRVLQACHLWLSRLYQQWAEWQAVCSLDRQAALSAELFHTHPSPCTWLEHCQAIHYSNINIPQIRW